MTRSRRSPERRSTFSICLECRTKIWCEKELRDLNASCDACGEPFLTPEELKEELLNRGGNDE